MSEHHEMPPASAAPAAPPAVPQDQHLPKQEPLPAASTPPSSVAATAAAATAAVGATPMNGNAGPVGENLICDWGECKQQLPNAEALYEHICERHVGRKSTNNLNLTCQWGNCKTTTVKRDHITSHIRVHVPLKPHKCPTCGKAFKRPQDLKKHVKTHADDSVLIQSPEPAARNPDMMFGAPPRPQYNGYPPSHYFEPLNPVPSQSYAPSGHYFQPPPQTHSSYGNVYYTLNQGHEANHGSYESKKRGYDALNEFFGDLKRRQFDPSSYAAIGQRLMGIQGLQLPMLNGATEYQTMPAPVAVGAGGGGGGGGYSSAGPAPAPTYHLPPMSNARTKDDLVTLDHVLEQMQNTIYESDENLQASGVGQPGAHFVHGGMNYRPGNSPPTQLPRSHLAPTSTAAPAIGNITAQSPSTGTPALTPPSSAQSYTSGRSPASLPGQHVSPTHNEGSSSMYPRLPAATVPDGMAAGYPTATSTAPPSTLGGVFDNDDRRRYTGGTLQRARPEERRHSDEMDISQSGKEDGERTPQAKEQSKSAEEQISANLIDPALSNGAQDAQRTAQAATEVAERADTKWVEKARLIEALRSWVSSRLERGEFEAAPAQQGVPFGYSEAMDGVETDRPETRDEEQKESGDTVMYPTLHGADDESDTQMN